MVMNLFSIHNKETVVLFSVVVWFFNKRKICSQPRNPGLISNVFQGNKNWEEVKPSWLSVGYKLIIKNLGKAIIIVDSLIHIYINFTDFFHFLYAIFCLCIDNFWKDPPNCINPIDLLGYELWSGALNQRILSVNMILLFFLITCIWGEIEGGDAGGVRGVSPYNCRFAPHATPPALHSTETSYYAVTHPLPC